MPRSLSSWPASRYTSGSTRTNRSSEADSPHASIETVSPLPGGNASAPAGSGPLRSFRPGLEPGVGCGGPFREKGPAPVCPALHGLPQLRVGNRRTGSLNRRRVPSGVGGQASDFSRIRLSKPPPQSRPLPGPGQDAPGRQAGSGRNCRPGDLDRAGSALARSHHRDGRGPRGIDGTLVL